MATYQEFDFNDPDLDYNDVLTVVYMMYSDILHQGSGCCSSSKTESILCQVDGFLQDIEIVGDPEKPLYNEDRWKEDIKGAYFLLENFFRLSVSDVSPIVNTPFPEEALDVIERGEQYFSNLQAEYLADLKRGCNNCKPTAYTCLKRLLRALNAKNELDQYDDISIVLIHKVEVIIGDYTLQVPPTVNAGADQSVPINETAYFSATIVEGSAPIASIQWSIVSGSGTLTNSTTADLIVDDFPIGGTVLKIVVKDTNGLTDSDTLILTGTAATMKVYYISKSTNVLPIESEILAADFVNIVPGAASYVVPINTGFNYHFVFQLATEPNKVRWADTIDPDNNGVMGVGNTWYATANVAAFEGYGNSFKTEFDNPLSFIS